MTEFERIIEEIKSGLTGDSRADLQYLMEQSQKYRSHELAKEILRECGHLMYRVIPEEGREEVANFQADETQAIYAQLDQVKFCVYKHDLAQALRLMEELVQRATDYEAAGMYQDDSESVYFNFVELFEEMLYVSQNDPEREVRDAQFPYSAIYYQYGNLLIDLERYQEANEALSKAHRWSPTNAMVALEYAETFKLLGDLESFYRVTKEAFKYAFTRETLGHCYRNLGFYCVEKEMWTEAMAYNILGAEFNPENNNAYAELYYIRRVTGGCCNEPSGEEVTLICKKHDIPIGPDRDVVRLALAYADSLAETEDYKLSLYLYEIVYNLIEDENIKADIERIRGRMN